MKQIERVEDDRVPRFVAQPSKGRISSFIDRYDFAIRVMWEDGRPVGRMERTG